MPAPRKTTKLKAPPGTDEVNVGETRIPVSDAGTVEVPDEAVESLTGVGGCTLADVEIAPVPEGHVEVDHADPGASLSFGGTSYARDEDGRMFVPLAAVPHLISHGFRLITLEEIAAKLHAAFADTAVPAGEAPAETPTETPADEAPAGEPPAGEPPATDPAAEGAPAGEAPAA